MNLKEGIEKIKDLIEKFTSTPESVVLKFKDYKLQDGTTIIRTPVELKQGEAVTIVTDQGELPCPDGEYILEDGSELNVSGGLVAEYKPAEVSDPNATPETPAAASSTTPATGAMEVKTAPKRVIKSQVEEHVFSIELEDYEVIKVDLSSMFKSLIEENKTLKELNKEMFGIIKEISGEPAAAATEKKKEVFNISAWKKAYKADIEKIKADIDK